MQAWNECQRCDPNVLLLGPPGAGKSMLVRRLATILPDKTLAEAIDTTRIHSVAGLTGRRTAVVTARLFRAPHHTISDVDLTGRLWCRWQRKSRWRITARCCWMSCPSLSDV